jgi:hypothetical protein
MYFVSEEHSFILFFRNMSDEGESVQKQKTHRKLRKKTRAFDNDQSIEIYGEDTNGTEQDEGMQSSGDFKSQHSSSSSTPKHRRQSRRKSGSGSSRHGRKRSHSHTAITAVLEELSDDLVDEPPRGEGGNKLFILFCTLYNIFVHIRTSFENHFLHHQLLLI